VKFIFATTEIRKVPVTVLSRCQRFDLRRIEPETMIAHLRAVAGKEGASVADDALALIARAAEGSVRDAMSLLDQAISHGAGETGAEQVRAMLGLADRARVMDLFDLIMAGEAAGALSELSRQYADGADPLAVLRDLAEITHWVSVVKITPAATDDPTVAPDERVRGLSMAERLPMRALTRMWQMLLKALDEVAQAPNAMMAAEMAVIRLTHVSTLPSPEELVARLEAAPPPAPSGGGRAPSSAGGQTPRAQAVASAPMQTAPAPSGAATALALQPETALARFPRFETVLDLIRANRDVKLLIEAETYLRLARYAPGRIEFEPAPGAPADLAQRLGQKLQAFTGQRWAVSVVANGGAPTIAEARGSEETALKAQAEAHPLVQSVLAAFPGARVADVRSNAEKETAAAEAALPEAEDEWDPFEEG
jgi:DNA polymerase-3 subunit gamma/tau